MDHYYNRLKSIQLPIIDLWPHIFMKIGYLYSRYLYVISAITQTFVKPPGVWWILLKISFFFTKISSYMLIDTLNRGKNVLRKKSTSTPTCVPNVKTGTFKPEMLNLSYFRSSNGNVVREDPPKLALSG